MKQIKFFLVAVMSIVVANVAMSDDRPILPDQLPQNAKAFIQSNFQGKKVMYAEKDWNSYECHLDDGTKIEFSRKGNWDKVDCHFSPVPANIVPAVIRQYVKANYAGIEITKIDKERYGYEIELSNDLELKFNHQGTLIGMDGTCWDD